MLGKYNYCQEKYINPETGLTAYQELQWLSAIKLYGLSIMDNSLLTREQKRILAESASLA